MTWWTDVILVGRNRVMARRVIELLRTNPGSSLFFAFGVGHFTGEDSVIDMMREAGFQVERVGVYDDLNNWQSRYYGGAQRRAFSFLLVPVVTLISLNV